MGLGLGEAQEKSGAGRGQGDGLVGPQEVWAWPYGPPGSRSHGAGGSLGSEATVFDLDVAYWSPRSRGRGFR